MRTRSICRADDLARHLEVSVRTIYRDIAHLQASGLPIEGEAGVGYLLRPGFDLPSITFTHDQVEALAAGLSFVARTGDPALASAAREARAKIQASMPEPEARALSDAPYFTVPRQSGAPPYAGLIRTAIRTRRLVQMGYLDGIGQSSERRVRPLAIWSLADGWMFSAWCELRGDFRTFRFERIAGLILMDDLFDDDPAKGLRAFLARDRCEAGAGPPPADDRGE